MLHTLIYDFSLPTLSLQKQLQQNNLNSRSTYWLFPELVELTQLSSHDISRELAKDSRLTVS